jgi:amidohydrolase
MSPDRFDVIEAILPDVVALRHDIHRHPGLSGQEQSTADRLLEYLKPAYPDIIHRGLGGHGIVVVFSGAQKGPTTLFTCELDAVPITDQRESDHRSLVPGVGHMCGHDGHMATLAGLGMLLGKHRPACGRIVLLFRPQEETGAGAPAMVEELRKKKIVPDLVFGFHNMPDFPLGNVLFRRGQFAWAATDYVVELTGRSSHGGQPGGGCSPAMPLARLIQRFETLSSWSDGDPYRNAGQAAYAQLGESDHGTTPGKARLRATLRSQTDKELDALCRRADRLVADIAASHDLAWTCRPENRIPATVSHDAAIDALLAAAANAGLPSIELDLPQRWSDDCGVLMQHFPGAFFGMGGGSACGQLHGPDFDYPDEIIKPAVGLYWALVKTLHGGVNDSRAAHSP